MTTLAEAREAVEQAARIAGNTAITYQKHVPGSPCIEGYLNEAAALRHAAELLRGMEVKVMPRGGMQTNWWEEWVKLARRYRKLKKAAKAVLDKVDANLDERPWPVKYGAPFGELTALREALAADGPLPAAPVGEG